MLNMSAHTIQQRYNWGVYFQHPALVVREFLTDLNYHTLQTASLPYFCSVTSDVSGKQRSTMTTSRTMINVLNPVTVHTSKVLAKQCSSHVVVNSCFAVVVAHGLLLLSSAFAKHTLHVQLLLHAQVHHWKARTSWATST